MDASYKIQRGIHVHLIQFFMCPEFWIHIIIRSPLSGQVRSDFVQHGQDYFLRLLFQAAAQLHRPAPDKCTKQGKIKQKVPNCRYKQFGT